MRPLTCLNDWLSGTFFCNDYKITFWLRFLTQSTTTLALYNWLRTRFRFHNVETIVLPFYDIFTLFVCYLLKVWFQNRRAKFRKQERLAQQKVTNTSSDSPIKSEGKSMGNTTPKDIKPGSPNSTVSTTPNSSASSHHSNGGGDIKPLNGSYFFSVSFFFAKHSSDFGICVFWKPKPAQDACDAEFRFFV